ncbi:hypothetical protein KCTC52924_00149 [Arenibacter antarcticus]
MQEVGWSLSYRTFVGIEKSITNLSLGTEQIN